LIKSGLSRIGRQCAEIFGRAGGCIEGKAWLLLATTICAARNHDRVARLDHFTWCKVSEIQMLGNLRQQHPKVFAAAKEVC
jgi:hypothetical protein